MSRLINQNKWATFFNNWRIARILFQAELSSGFSNTNIRICSFSLFCLKVTWEPLWFRLLIGLSKCQHGLWEIATSVSLTWHLKECMIDRNKTARLTVTKSEHTIAQLDSVQEQSDTADLHWRDWMREFTLTHFMSFEYLNLRAAQSGNWHTHTHTHAATRWVTAELHKIKKESNTVKDQVCALTGSDVRVKPGLYTHSKPSHSFHPSLFLHILKQLLHFYFFLRSTF